MPHRYFEQPKMLEHLVHGCLIPCTFIPQFILIAVRLFRCFFFPSNLAGDQLSYKSFSPKPLAALVAPVMGGPVISFVSVETCDPQRVVLEHSDVSRPGRSRRSQICT